MNKEDTRKLIQADYGEISRNEKIPVKNDCQLWGISRNVKYTRKELPRCNHSTFIIACRDTISILQKE